MNNKILIIISILLTLKLGAYNVNANTNYSDDLKALMSYQEGCLITKCNFDEIAKQTEDIESYINELGNETYVFDFRGIENFKSLDSIMIPFDLSENKVVTNLVNIPIGYSEVEAILLTSSYNNNELIFEEFQYTLENSSLTQLKEFGDIFKSQFISLNNNYEGYTKKIYVPTEILSIIESYDWLIGQAVNFNIVVENEENINKFVNVTKKFTDREIFNIKLSEDFLPNSIRNIDDFYASSPFDEQHVYFDLDDLANYLMDLSFDTNYTLNFDDENKPLSHFKLNVLMYSGIEFTIDTKILFDYLNDNDTLADDRFNIFTGNDYHFDKIKEINLEFEQTDKLEESLRGINSAYKTCSFDTFNSTLELSDCLFEGESIFNIFTYRRNGKEDYNDDYGGVSFSYYPYYNAYTVVYDSKGGSAIPTSYNNVAKSKIMEPEIPTKLNYLHDGWFLDEDLTEKWDFDYSVISSDITLYAKWIEDTKVIIPDLYTVRFETNGGSNVDSLTGIPYDSKLDNIYETFKNGFNFEGWFKDSARTVKWNFEEDKVTDHIVIYADWNQDTDRELIIPPNNNPVDSNDKIETPNTSYNSNIESYYSLIVVSLIFIYYTLIKKRGRI